MIHLWTRSDNKRIGFACTLHSNSIASHGANPGWQATESIDRDARAMRWLVIYCNPFFGHCYGSFVWFLAVHFFRYLYRFLCLVLKFDMNLMNLDNSDLFRQAVTALNMWYSFASAQLASHDSLDTAPASQGCTHCGNQRLFCFFLGLTLNCWIFWRGEPGRDLVHDR